MKANALTSSVIMPIIPLKLMIYAAAVKHRLFVELRIRVFGHTMASINEDYLCPITHEVMMDPVIDPDGYTYERAAIEAWIRSHGTSPFTRAPLSLGRLVPNRCG